MPRKPKSQPELAPAEDPREILIDAETGRPFRLRTTTCSHWEAVWIDPETGEPTGERPCPLLKNRFLAAKRKENS
jgi:hypothetical protein